MRQAGRYMAAFREYSDRHAFRHRSETSEIAIELSLQPWRAFGTDAVIMFSDILTPLPALGVEFDVVRGKGPVFDTPMRSSSSVRQFLDAVPDYGSSLPFIAEILGSLKGTLAESQKDTTLLGFVGAPFTLAAYMIEGRGVKHLSQIKSMMYASSTDDFYNPIVLHDILAKLSDAIAQYAIHQLDCGAQAVQLFDSWAHHLSPDQYKEIALPYAAKVAQIIRAQRPNAVIIFFANGSGGKLHDISEVIAPLVDVIGIDWGVRMSEARAILGESVVLQGNVDPSILTFGSEEQIRKAVRDTVRQAGGEKLILNLGHGVIKETPESSVAAFVDEVKQLSLSPVS